MSRSTSRISRDSMFRAARRVLFQTLLLIISASSLHAQFAVVPASLPQVYGSSVAWADYDNDGWLDFAMIGTLDTVDDKDLDWTKSVAKIFHNNGNGTFTENTLANLAPVCYGTIAWGDYDNDGRLDLLYGGIDLQNNQVTKLYHNNGNGTFTENIQTSFHSSSYGCVTWGDFNNDGYLDILLSGVDTSPDISILSVTKLYRNNHDGSFTEMAAGLQGVNGLSKVSFGDYDNDGYLDILLNGRTTRDWTDPQSVTKLYHNNRGNGTFTEDLNAKFVSVSHGPSAFGDFNNDGFLDVYVNGIVGPGVGPPGFVPVTTAVVYLNNNGTGLFTTVSNPIPVSPFKSAVAVGDYDGDGKLDLLVNGYNSSPGLFKGTGGGTFTSQSPPAPELWWGGLAWGDFNSDGYLDALVSGAESGTANATILLLNTGQGTNAQYHVNNAPTAPTQLSSAVSGDAVTLTWGSATDPGQTPVAGLTYAVRVGTTPGGSDVVSLAARSDGKRLVAAFGAQGLNTHWILRGLAPGQYHWSVQAVDNGYLGSALAAEQTFTIPISVNAKVFLEGPFNTTAMNTSLRSGNLLPLTQPYNIAPWSYAGTESVAGIPADVVDWVLLELRTGTASATKVATRAAFIKSNGAVVDLDGTSPVAFPSLANGNYYIVVRHRNHLASMSKSPVALSASSALYDFTTGQAQAYGTNALKQLAPGVFGLMAGDANGSGIISNSDELIWWSETSFSGYLRSDFNLSGIVTILDQNLWWANTSLSTQVP